MLIDIHQTYGVAVHENGYGIGVLPVQAFPATLAEACKTGVEAKVANRGLYDRSLLPAGAAYHDLTQVMQRLRDA